MAQEKTPPKDRQIKPKKVQQPQIPSELSKEIEEIMRRLRLLEERYSGLRKKSQFTEQNMLKDAKEIFDEISILNESMSDLRSELSELNEKVLKLVEEVRGAVSKSDFNVLSKYLDYWEPMKFITKDEAERILAERIK